MTSPGTEQSAPARNDVEARPPVPAPRPRSRSRLRHLVFMLVPLAVVLLLAEIALGFYHHLHRYIARKYDFVAYVGWGTKENNRWVWENRPGFGRVEYSTKKHGFRAFGNPDTTGTRILVLGDSFTEAYTVSDGKAYYDYIGRHADGAEVFAYGCGGYGSLQEYFVLDRHFDEIRPGIVIWQFCSNDLVNNDFELESASHINNKHMVRPYLIDGKVKWKYPRQDFGLVYRIVQHSYLLRLLDLRLSMLKGAVKYSIETVISPEHPWVVRSAATTSQIMGMVRRRAGKARILAFNTERRYFTGNNWVGNHYERICRDNGIDYLDAVPDALDAATSQGLKINGAPFDPIHWNELGHEIVGRTLLRRLIDDKLVSGTIPAAYEAPIVRLDAATTVPPGQNSGR